MSITVPSTYKEWQDALDQAVKYQALTERFKRWGTIRDYYLNRYPENVISVNLLFARGRALVPQLYFKAPTLRVRPRPTAGLQVRDARRRARILEAVDDWLIEAMKLKGQLKLCILDSFRFNLGLLKVGYGLGEETPRDTAAQERDQAGRELQAVAETLGNETADRLEAAQRDTDEGRDLRIDYDDRILPDTPWVLRTPPEDSLVPWGTRDPYSAPWWAFRVVRPIEDLKIDPRYDNLEGIDPNSSGAPASGEKPREGIVRPLRSGPGSDEGALDYLEFFEIWDKRTGRVLAVVPDQGTTFLRNEKHRLGIRGAPVVVLQFNPDGDDFWGAADAEHILKQVVEYNEAKTQIAAHRRIANLRIGVDKNKVTKEEQRRMAGSDPGPVFEVDGTPTDAFAAVSNPIPPELKAMADNIRDDIQDVLGFNRNQEGAFEADRRTATEARIVQANVELRADERRDQVGDLIAELFADKIHPMIFRHWTAERVVEVTGEEGWVPYTGPGLAGEYLVDVVPDSMLPLGKAQAKQQAQALFGALKGDPRVNQQELYQWFLGHFEDVPADKLLRTEAEMAVLRTAEMGGMDPTQDIGQQLAMARRGAGQPGNGNGAGPPGVTAPTAPGGMG